MQIPWEVFVWAVGVAGGLAVLIFRSGAIYKGMRQHWIDYDEDSRRNCAHHGVLFKKLDIPYDEVAAAEKDVGVGPKKL